MTYLGHEEFLLHEQLVRLTRIKRHWKTRRLPSDSEHLAEAAGRLRLFLKRSGRPQENWMMREASVPRAGQDPRDAN